MGPRLIALLVSASGLPIFHPANAIERAGVTAALTSLETFGEGRTVSLILDAAPQLMNLSPAEIDPIRAKLEARYEELDGDPVWRELPSPLPSAFASSPPSMIAVPPARGDPKRAAVIVFLHGYGGSGKLFSFLLSRAIPEAWIVSPSHGISWARPNLRHLDGALTRFETESGIEHPRYHLVGLSDGGVGAFEVLARRPHRFRSMTSIVGIPRAETIARVPRSTPILMINGRGDRFVNERAVRSRFSKLRSHTGHAQLEWFDGGHYFLLDDDARALSRVREFIAQR